MPYYLIESELLSFSAKKLLAGETVEGFVGKRKTRIEIDNGKELAINGLTMAGPQGAVVFDREGRILQKRRVIVYLPQDDAYDFDVWQTAAEEGTVAPGLVQDIISGLERLGKEQAGDEKAARWGIRRFLSALISAGATERYSERG